MENHADLSPEIFLRLIQKRARESPEEKAFVVSGGKFVTWSSYFSRVRSIAESLIELGLGIGENVVLWADSRVEWVTFYLGVLFAGGIPVGIYPSLPPQQLLQELLHLEAKILIVDNQARVEDVFDKSKNLPLHVISLEKGSSTGSWLTAVAGKCINWTSSVSATRETNDQTVEKIKSRLKLRGWNDCAVIVFTSVSKKKVMLSFANIYGTAVACKEKLQIQSSDTYLTFLPLAHIVEQMFVILVPLLTGHRVHTTQKETLQRDVLEAKASIILGPPIFWDKYEKSLRDLFPRDYRSLRPLTSSSCDYVKKTFGFENLRLALNSFQGLRPETAEFFSCTGIQINELYSLTELAGPVAIKLSGEKSFRKLSTQTKLKNEDSELLVSGTGTFIGYWKDEDLTRRSFDAQKQFCSGDNCLFTEGNVDDQFNIFGKTDEVLVIKSGYQIPLKRLNEVESQLKQVPHISDVVVLGQGKDFLAALFGLDFNVMEKQIDLLHFCNLVRESVLIKINSVNQGLPEAETIKNYLIISKPLFGATSPSSMLGRRKFAHKEYSNEIDRLFSEATIRVVRRKGKGKTARLLDEEGRSKDDGETGSGFGSRRLPSPASRRRKGLSLGNVSVNTLSEEVPAEQTPSLLEIIEKKKREKLEREREKAMKNQEPKTEKNAAKEASQRKQPEEKSSVEVQPANPSTTTSTASSSSLPLPSSSSSTAETESEDRRVEEAEFSPPSLLEIIAERKKEKMKKLKEEQEKKAEEDKKKEATTTNSKPTEVNQNEDKEDKGRLEVATNRFSKMRSGKKSTSPSPSPQKDRAVVLLDKVDAKPNNLEKVDVKENIEQKSENHNKEQIEENIGSNNRDVIEEKPANSNNINNGEGNLNHVHANEKIESSSFDDNKEKIEDVVVDNKEKVEHLNNIERSVSEERVVEVSPFETLSPNGALKPTITLSTLSTSSSPSTSSILISPSHSPSPSLSLATANLADSPTGSFVQKSSRQMARSQSLPHLEMDEIKGKDKENFVLEVKKPSNQLREFISPRRENDLETEKIKEKTVKKKPSNRKNDTLPSLVIDPSDREREGALLQSLKNEKERVRSLEIELQQEREKNIALQKELEKERERLRSLDKEHDEDKEGHKHSHEKLKKEKKDKRDKRDKEKKDKRDKKEKDKDKDKDNNEREREKEKRKGKGKRKRKRGGPE